MMTDRELYELVAKAAGITGYVCEDWTGVYFCTPADPAVIRSEPVFYRWLHDDGDALRLAVKLALKIEHHEDSVVVWDDYIGTGYIGYDGDPYAATRRAIVLAAAEIGKAMP